MCSWLIICWRSYHWHNNALTHSHKKGNKREWKKKVIGEENGRGVLIMLSRLFIFCKTKTHIVSLNSFLFSGGDIPTKWVHQKQELICLTPLVWSQSLVTVFLKKLKQWLVIHQIFKKSESYLNYKQIF